MRFSVFGIPVTVDVFFLIGLALVWSWAGGDRGGLFAALFVGVFTLAHELGHALTARKFGAVSAIRLNLLVGWASYAAPRPLTRRQRNLISLAGPLTQIVLCLPVLFLAYEALPSPNSLGAARAVLDGSLALDVWRGAIWAGIVIGLLNLLPLWPLDGAHIVDSFLGGALGDRRGRRAMLVATLALVGVITVLGLLVQNLTQPYNGLERLVVDAKLGPIYPLTHDSSFFRSVWEQIRVFPGNVLDFPFLLLIFCGLNSVLELQRLPRHDRVATWLDVQQAPKRKQAAGGDAGVSSGARDAERAGWLESRVGKFPAGWGPSPWLSAHLALLAGHGDEARQALGRVVAPGRPRWTLPDPASQPSFGPLVPMLPDPLPLGDAERNVTLMRVLAAHGSSEQIAHYGVALYGQSHDAEVLYLVAAGLGRTGAGDDAMAWLRRAVQDKPDHQRLATDRGLWPLHNRPDFQQLLAQTRGAR